MVRYRYNDTKNVIIPKEVTSIGNYAFFGCDHLKSITIPEDVTSIGEYAFSRCDSLQELTIPEGVTSIGENAFEYIPHIEYHGSAEGAPWGAQSMN